MRMMKPQIVPVVCVFLICCVCFLADVVTAKDVAVKLTGYVHDTNSTTKESSQAARCHELTPCMGDLQRLLMQPENIVRSILETQADTTKDINLVMIDFDDDESDAGSRRRHRGGPSRNKKKNKNSKKKQVAVPVYHFKQPKRLSDAELPFQLMLFQSLDSIPYYISEVDDMNKAKDSWFPGYYWSHILICDCNTRSYRHIGWKFTKWTKTTTTEMIDQFYAIIVQTVESSSSSSTSNKASDKEIHISGFQAPGWMLSNLIASKNVTDQIGSI